VAHGPEKPASDRNLMDASTDQMRHQGDSGNQNQRFLRSADASSAA
jgi:hypothetical protein